MLSSYHVMTSICHILGPVRQAHRLCVPERKEIGAERRAAGNRSVTLHPENRMNSNYKIDEKGND